MNFKRERTCFASGPSSLPDPYSDEASFCFVCFFSAKTTVQWYFIVGPLLAVTVLAFVVLYLWKRRIAGRCALNFASFLGPYQENK